MTDINEERQDKLPESTETTDVVEPAPAAPIDPPPAGPAGADAPSPKGKSTLGIDENIAGALAYLLPPLTSILFLITDKENRFIKFHALQSLFICLVFIAAGIVVGILSLIPIVNLLGWVLGVCALPLAGLFLWVFLMYKAFKHETYELPILGPIVTRQLDVIS